MKSLPGASIKQLGAGAIARSSRLPTRLLRMTALALAIGALISIAAPLTTAQDADECRTGNCIVNAKGWVTDSFRITAGGNDRLFLNTWVHAFIADEKGWAKTDGCCLKISNNSRKYSALYNHLGTPPNMELLPGQELLIPLPIYRAKGDHRATVIELALRYHP